jgi:hypothetical protein
MGTPRRDVRRASYACSPCACKRAAVTRAVHCGLEQQLFGTVQRTRPDSWPTSRAYVRTRVARQPFINSDAEQPVAGVRDNARFQPRPVHGEEAFTCAINLVVRGRIRQRSLPVWAPGAH